MHCDGRLQLKDIVFFARRINEERKREETQTDEFLLPATRVAVAQEVQAPISIFSLSPQLNWRVLCHEVLNMAIFSLKESIAIQCVIEIVWHSTTRRLQDFIQAISVSWSVVRDEDLASENSTESKKDPPILNYISSHKNPITWGEYMKHNESGLQRPSVHCIWYYFFTLNKNYFIHMLYVYILQLVPAIVLDIVLYTLGKTPILWKTYRKIHRFTGIISYFSMKEFKFEDNNVDSMWEKMGSKDRQLFNFNIASLNWKSTITNGMLGLRANGMNSSRSIPAMPCWLFVVGGLRSIVINAKRYDRCHAGCY
uniref:Fatty acyl-CoA reductase C-terminal domain-containing protein n=1 Tax=Timema cristinae TaxID=61476 RepID=A0A7R9H5I3_TIMCR|nr:unnamed protein product [Timema cristinae]